MIGGTRDGPIEAHPWPETLTARVVTPGARPRLHGFDVEQDLARHYSFGELVLTALTGEAPEPATGRAFEVCLAFLAPICVAEAPCHAARLAQNSGARPCGVLATGAVGLTEQARWVIEEHGELLAWLGGEGKALPARYKAIDSGDRKAVQRLRRALEATGVTDEVLSQDPTRTTALLAVLYRCGLTRAEQLETVWVLARLPALAAESFSARAGAIRDYPLRLPEFEYVEGE